MRRLRESNPRPLRAAVFKTVSSTNRAVSLTNSDGPSRTDSDSFKASHADPYTTPRQSRPPPNQRRPTGSEPVVRPLHQKPLRELGIEPRLTAWKAVVLCREHYTREQAAEAGIEPATNVFNRHAQLPAVAPPQLKVSVVGFEPTISTSRPSRDAKLRYTLMKASGGSRTRTSAMARQ
jgi:hypothetical protein